MFESHSTFCTCYDCEVFNAGYDSSEEYEYDWNHRWDETLAFIEALGGVK